MNFGESIEIKNNLKPDYKYINIFVCVCAKKSS